MTRKPINKVKFTKERRDLHTIMGYTIIFLDTKLNCKYGIIIKSLSYKVTQELMFLYTKGR